MTDPEIHKQLQQINAQLELLIKMTDRIIEARVRNKEGALTESQWHGPTGKCRGNVCGTCL